MDNKLDQTTLETISLLEARLEYIEYLLFGPSGTPPEPPVESATSSLAELERRFNRLLRHVRVYADILRIYKQHPSVFPNSTLTAKPSSPDQPDSAKLPPPDMPPELVRAAVLGYASSFPSTASALTAATSDTPIPDAEESARLAALGPRMRGLALLQRAQELEMAELRRRSERVLRVWYQNGILRSGAALADADTRLQRVERGLRRAAKRREDELAAV